MFIPEHLSIFIAISCCVGRSLAIFNPSAKTNVAVYWGQGAGQQRLSHFCAQQTIDIIPLAFMNVVPSHGNGYPGTNFGNQCGAGVFSGPGYNGVVNHAADSLSSACPFISSDITLCQAAGKKVVLSLGGAIGSYQLASAADGEYLADFLWGAYGPQKSTWSGPRPFDGANGQAVEIDGFDFDIESTSTSL